MTPNQRRVTALGLAAAIAAPMEGLRQYAYYDPPGILTVCRGHTGPDVVKGKRYSLAECDAYLNVDMRKAILIVDTCAPGLPVEVLAAFSDKVYNSGSKIACDTTPWPKGSTAARMLAVGNYRGACNELPKWNKAHIAGVVVALPGLTKRQGLEQELCLTGVNDA